MNQQQSPTQISKRESQRLRERFLTRAQAVFFARIVFMILTIGIIFFPTWSSLYSSNDAGAKIAFVIYIISTFSSRVIAPHPKHGRWAMFSSLILDLLLLLSLIFQSGGLQSPMMAGLILLTIFFALLFPSPVAIVPPFLALPVIAALAPVHSYLQPSVSILLISLHSVLNGVAVYVIVYLTAREEKDSREILELQQELKGLAVAEERNRLAREIHDGVGAALSGLIIQSEYLQVLSRDYPEVLEEVTEMKSAAEESIDEVRRALTMMQDDFVLVPQLENACTTFTTRHRLPIKLKINGDSPALSEEQQLGIFRILQESLNNASKHAEAGEVLVNIDFADVVQLKVEDNGKGFDINNTPSMHYGLQNMKDRARKIDGTISVESEIGKGTIVTLRVKTKKKTNMALL